MTSSLYIPGLGGTYSIYAQRSWIWFINIFRRRENRISFFDPRWNSQESYHDKFTRLRQCYIDAGNPKSIWGVSAGASLAAYLGTEITQQTSLNFVCGKILGSSKIGTHYSTRAPAIVESVRHSESSYSKLNSELCTCYVPQHDADGVIETIDMIIPGARVIDLPPFRHARAILYALFHYLPRS